MTVREHCLSVLSSYFSVIAFTFYIYAFSRRFYSKRLSALLSGYKCIISMCAPWELNPQSFALLMQYSTTETQDTRLQRSSISQSGCVLVQHHCCKCVRAGMFGSTAAAISGPLSRNESDLVSFAGGKQQGLWGVWVGSYGYPEIPFAVGGKLRNAIKLHQALTVLQSWLCNLTKISLKEFCSEK